MAGRDGYIVLYRYYGSADRVVSWSVDTVRDAAFDALQPQVGMQALRPSRKMSQMGGTVRIGMRLDDINNDLYNYARYDAGDISFYGYYFIKDKVYVNENTTDLVLELDVFTTFMFSPENSWCERISGASYVLNPEFTPGGLDYTFIGGEFHQNFSAYYGIAGLYTGSGASEEDIKKERALCSTVSNVGTSPVGFFKASDPVGMLTDLQEKFNSENLVAGMFICDNDVSNSTNWSGVFDTPRTAQLNGQQRTYNVNVPACDAYDWVHGEISIFDHTDASNSITVPRRYLPAGGGSMNFEVYSDPMGGTRLYKWRNFSLSINIASSVPTASDPSPRGLTIANAQRAAGHTIADALYPWSPQSLPSTLTKIIAGTGAGAAMTKNAVGAVAGAGLGLIDAIGEGVTSALQAGNRTDAEYKASTVANATAPMTGGGAYSGGIYPGFGVGIDVFVGGVPSYLKTVWDNYRAGFGGAANRMLTPPFRSMTSFYFKGAVNAYQAPHQWACDDAREMWRALCANGVRFHSSIAELNSTL